MRLKNAGIRAAFVRIDRLGKAAHEPAVAAAMPGAVVRHGKALCRTLGKAAQNHNAVLHAAADLPLGAHQLDGARVALRKRRHGEHRGNAALKFQRGDLVVTDIVVAAVDASAIWIGLQRLNDRGVVRAAADVELQLQQLAPLLGREYSYRQNRSRRCSAQARARARSSP